jgi:DNA-binding transcriptional ArsR family regulator
MPPKVDRTAFLLEPTRMKIAELCRDESLSLSEIAAELGRPSGSLSQPRTMLRRKALIEGQRGGASDGRGGARTFRLNGNWKSALDEARLRRRPNWSTVRRDLLVVQLADTPAACAAVAEGIPDIEWGAQVRGAVTGLVLAPSADGDGASTVRVVAALGAVSARVAELHLSDVMAPAELREWSARAARRSGAAGGLPRGS